MSYWDLGCTHTARTVDLTAGGYSVLAEGTSFGSLVRNPLFAQVFDAQRVVVAGAPVGAREQQIRVEVTAASVTALQTLLDTLATLCDELTRRGGGWLRHRATGASGVTRYRVIAAKLSEPERMGAWYESGLRVVVTLGLVVDPFGLADPLDITDPFSTDTLGTGGRYNLGGADWTVETAIGTTSAPAITGGKWVTSATTGTGFYYHTGTPHTVGDVQVTAKIRANTAYGASWNAGVIKRAAGTTFIRGYVVSTTGTTTGTLQMQIGVSASYNTRVSTAITLPAVGTDFWVRLRVEGNVATVEYWTTEPTPMATPTASGSWTLTSAEAAALGGSVAGRAALVWNTMGAGTTSFDDFRVRPLTYRNVTFPATLRLEGAWGGTTDALAGIYYTGSGGTAPVAMMYAWWPRVSAHNYVWNGGAESIGTTATVAYGWSAAAAASGYTVAATSVVRTTAAASVRTGSAAFECVTPATSASGAHHRIYRRGGFRQGVTYTVSMYLRSAASVTPMVVGLGSAGADRGISSAIALSTAWTQHAVTWTPAANSDFADVFARTNAATATTFQFDDVQVYEGTTAPTCELGGFGPGIIPAAAYNLATASIAGGTAWTQTTDADYLVGYGPQASGALSTNGNLDIPILPHLFTPDDYTSDEVDVAVFARIEVASTQTSLACAISMASERGTSYGARRYSNFRSGGKTLKLPSAGTVFKPYYLGRLTLKVDKSRPRREWLRLSFTNSGAATGTVGVDYLIVVPARCVAGSQRGAADAVVPDFIASTAETTKVIGVGSAGEITGMLTGSIVEHANGDAFTPDDGLCGEHLRLPADGCELLVWPSDQVVDLTDSSSHSMAETFAGTVRVAVQPRTNLLKG